MGCRHCVVERRRPRTDPAGGAAGARITSRWNDRLVARWPDAGNWRDTGTRTHLQRQPAARPFGPSGALWSRPRLSTVDRARATHRRRGRASCRHAGRAVPGDTDARVRQRVEHVEADVLRLGQRVAAVGSPACRVPSACGAGPHAGCTQMAPKPSSGAWGSASISPRIVDESLLPARSRVDRRRTRRVDPF